MNLPSFDLLWIKFGAIAIALASVTAYHVHAVSSAHLAGKVEESERRDVIDARNTSLANIALRDANEKVRAQQAQIATMQSDLEHLSQENLHAKLDNAQRHADLLAGRDRMRVDVQPAARDPAQAGPAGGAAAAAMDQGTGAQYDLAPGVAAGLDAIRERHNEAVRRLGACIVAYDTIQAAENAAP